MMEWLTKYWKTFAAIFYIVVCFIDFIVMPFFLMGEFQKLFTIENYQILHGLWGDDPMILQMILDKKLADWTPYTLRGAGIFHISFGAILGVTALNGKKKKD